MRAVIWAVVGIAACAGVARAGTVYPLGGGWYGWNDDHGNSGTSYPLGGGWRGWSDNQGNSGTSYPLGGGWRGFTENPSTIQPYQPYRIRPYGQ